MGYIITSKDRVSVISNEYYFRMPLMLMFTRILIVELHIIFTTGADLVPLLVVRSCGW